MTKFKPCATPKKICKLRHGSGPRCADNVDPSQSELLVVEGNDEIHVVKKLLKRHNLRQSFNIEPKDGFDAVRQSIYNEVNTSGRRVLGMLADANANSDRRWQLIADSLRNAGCNVPAALPEAGSLFAGPRGMQVGVWLMPNNVRPGQLEDYIAASIPQPDSI